MTEPSPTSPGLRRFAALLAAALLAAPGAGAAEPSPAAPLSPDEGYGLIGTFLEAGHGRGDRRAAAQRLTASGDASLVPGLVDALFFAPAHSRGQLLAVLRELTGENPGSGYYDWVELVGRRSDLEPKPGYLQWKASLLANIDPEFRKILYPGAPHRIRLEEIVWGGARVDQIPTLTDPPVVRADEASVLTRGEEVFGVALGGEHRAYPLRYLSWHELLNDVVGGRPLALSF